MYINYISFIIYVFGSCIFTMNYELWTNVTGTWMENDAKLSMNFFAFISPVQRWRFDDYISLIIIDVKILPDKSVKWISRECLSKLWMNELVNVLTKNNPLRSTFISEENCSTVFELTSFAWKSLDLMNMSIFPERKSRSFVKFRVIALFDAEFID